MKFQKKIPALWDMFSSGNPREKDGNATKKDRKQKYPQTFNIQNWEKMTAMLIPGEEKNQLGEIAKNSLFIVGKKAKIKPWKAGEAKEISRALYNEVNATFQRDFK